MFRSSTILRELVQSLAKVIFLLKHSLKLRLCGSMSSNDLRARKPFHDMLPRLHIIHIDVILMTVLTEI
jgi:hypothetical protein